MRGILLEKGGEKLTKGRGQVRLGLNEWKKREVPGLKEPD